ncbi:hypothetical protein AB0C34_02565 [Nocardia sp. NPDC049220]|uniref:hypothetical protein n=1 Tax=Nocardia sp. NPDC049220 TaxID=3155273 RepID=UPI0033DDCB64
MYQDTHRTRRILARVAVASALALMPVTALAVPALASPIVLEPAAQIDLAHGGPGHRHDGPGNGNWNRGRHDHNDWNRGRHDHNNWNRGRHDHNDWNRGWNGNGWDGGFRGFLPRTGSF